MKIKRFLASLLALVMVLGMTPVAMADDAALPEAPHPVFREFYVSPYGNDANSGTADAPFLTIQRAKDAVDEINETMTGDIIVNIAEGTYEMERHLSFRTEDSGFNGYDVIYRGNKQNPPLLSGGTDISGGWEVHNATKGIYVKKLEGFDAMRELYVNGERRFMAQTEDEIKPQDQSAEMTKYINSLPQELRPNSTYAELTKRIYCDPDTEYIHDGMYFLKTDLPLITENASDVEMYQSGECNDYMYAVDKIIQDPHREDYVVAIMSQNVFDFICKKMSSNDWLQGKPPRGNVRFRNAYELLDNPGEFYYNRKTKELFYMPYDYEDMSTAEVVAPKIDKLLNFRGDSMGNKVHNIKIEGLELAYTTLAMLSIRYEGQTNTVQSSRCANSFDGPYAEIPGTVYLINAQDIVFEGNVIHSIASTAIQAQTNNKDIVIEGNCFYDIGASAIYAGTPLARDDYIYKHALDAYPKGDPYNGQLMNLITNEDSDAWPNYDGINSKYDKDQYNVNLGYAPLNATLGDCWGEDYMWQSFVDEKTLKLTERNTWKSDPHGAEKGIKAEVVYDVKDYYTIDEITVVFNLKHTTDEMRSNFEILLSNDMSFAEENTYKVAEQKEAFQGEIATYKVNTDEKYRYIMLRKTDFGRFGYSYMAATTPDVPVYHKMYEQNDGIYIRNNWIERTGVSFPISNAIFTIIGDNYWIQHNTIKSTPYVGVNSGWSWAYTRPANVALFEQPDGSLRYDSAKYFASVGGQMPNESAPFDNGDYYVAEYNWIEDSSQSGLDGAPVYTLGTYGVGSRINDNVIKDGNIGIRGYYQDGSTDYLSFYNNVAEDCAAFDSAAYSGINPWGGFYMPFYNNYSNHINTDAVKTSMIAIREDINVYPVGLPTENAYNIKANAGVEEEYKYLADFVEENGSQNHTDAEMAYYKQRDMSANNKMAAQDAGRNTLELARYGNMLGAYPYEWYYKLKDKYIDFSGAGNASCDIEDFRNFLFYELEPNVRRYSIDDTLKLCEDALGTLTDEEDIKVLSEAIETAKARITDGLKDYRTLVTLEDAYNSIFNNDGEVTVNYAHVKDMLGVDINEETKTVTFYVKDINAAKSMEFDIELPVGVEVADVFGKEDLVKGIKVPIYNKETRENAIWSFKAVQGSDEVVATKISADAFTTTTSDYHTISEYADKVFISGDTNATVSKYYDPTGKNTEFEFAINAPYIDYDFSLLFGIDATQKFMVNSLSGTNKYYKLTFKDDFAYLYAVDGSADRWAQYRTLLKDTKPKLIGAKRVVVTDDTFNKVRYTITPSVNSTYIKIWYNDKVLFETTASIATNGKAWAYYSLETPVFIKK